jgi:hypothetical protein
VYRITQEFPRLIQCFRLRAFHPLWSAFPYASPNTNHATSGSYNPGSNASGLGWSAFVRHYLRNHIRFLFLTLLRCFTSGGLANPLLFDSERNVTGKPLQVILFGDPRVTACLRLSEAYRSLSRPSSPASAKAFTMRPLYLVLLQKFPFQGTRCVLIFICSFGSIKLSIITLRAVVKEPLVSLPL